MAKITPLFALCLAVALTACSQYQDNSLLTDAKVVDCPIGCAANLKPEDSQIAIKIMNTSFTVAATDTRADIGGECYASHFPSNKIIVQVNNLANTASFAVLYYGVDANPSNVVCKNGRFDVSIDFSTLAAGSYSVRATLVAKDDAGVEHRNETDGTSAVVIRKLPPPAPAI